MNQYKEVLKEVAPGVWTHSHWVDEEGNVVPAENIVIPTIEYDQMKADIAEAKVANAEYAAILEDAIMRGVL